MTSEQGAFIDKKLKGFMGDLLGLKAILIAIAADNKNLKVDEKRIGKLILELPIDGGEGWESDVQIKARAVMHEFLGRKNEPNI
jgi:hypothetical protein